MNRELLILKLDFYPDYGIIAAIKFCDNQTPIIGDIVKWGDDQFKIIGYVVTASSDYFDNNKEKGIYDCRLEKL